MSYTQCPQCQARFRVTAEQLQQAGGRVACGECGAVFDTAGRLSESLEAIPRDAPGEENAASPPGALPAGVDLFGQSEQLVMEPAAPEPEMPEVLVEDLRRARQAERRPLNWSRAGQWALALILFVAMLGQGVYLWRFELSRDPLYAPWVRGFCQLLHCEVPLPRFPDRIAVIERDVRLHPRVEHALVINATLVNQAPMTQAYPLIQLRMSDLSGTQVAGRWFMPRDYLRNPALAETGMQPGKPLHILLEVVDPGEDVVSFQFAFR